MARGNTNKHAAPCARVPAQIHAGTAGDPHRKDRHATPPPGLTARGLLHVPSFPPKALAPANKHPEKHGKRGTEASFEKLTREEVIFSEMEGVKRIPGQRGYGDRQCKGFRLSYNQRGKCLLTTNMHLHDV